MKYLNHLTRISSIYDEIKSFYPLLGDEKDWLITFTDHEI